MTKKRSSGTRRGGTIAEFLLVVPLLLVAVMGIAEFGTLFGDYLMISQGAREGARQLAIGSTLATTRSRIRQASYSSVTDSYIALEYYDTSSSSWLTVSDSTDGTSNGASTGVLVRARITSYPHHMVTGSFLSWLPGYSHGTLAMSAYMVMRRE